MKTSQITWEREFFRHGGQSPLIFYAIFGLFEEGITLSADYRSNGLPDGIRATLYDRLADPEIFASFLTSPLGQILGTQHPELQELVHLSPECLLVLGSVPDSSTLDYLRDVIGYITCAADSGGVAILDAQTLHWWNVPDWYETIFKPQEPNPHRHVVTFVNEDTWHNEVVYWIHTRGMRKFGRPDLSFRLIKGDDIDTVLSLCNQMIERQALGDLFFEGQPLTLAGFPKGITCHHAGTFDNPDFNNLHVEIRWPLSASLV